jgi:DNA-binding GntR family transcriptional regulator
VSAFAELMIIEQQMRLHLDAGEKAQASESKGKFHRSINRMAESPKLVSTLRSVTLGIQYDFMFVVPDWLERSLRDQDAVLEAMMSGDAELAAKLMYEHLQASASMIANVLVRSQGAEVTTSLPGFPSALGVLGDIPPIHPGLVDAADA